MKVAAHKSYSAAVLENLAKIIKWLIIFIVRSMGRAYDP
jgi:hypothetical protein